MIGMFQTTMSRLQAPTYLTKKRQFFWQELKHGQGLIKHGTTPASNKSIMEEKIVINFNVPFTKPGPISCQDPPTTFYWCPGDPPKKHQTKIPKKQQY